MKDVKRKYLDGITTAKNIPWYTGKFSKIETIVELVASVLRFTKIAKS